MPRRRRRARPRGEADKADGRLSLPLCPLLFTWLRFKSCLLARSDCTCPKSPLEWERLVHVRFSAKAAAAAERPLVVSMVDDAAAAAACGVVSPSANDPPLPPEVAAVLLPSGGHKANALRQIVAAEDGGNVCLASLWMFVPPSNNNNFYIPPTLTTMNRERKIRTVSHIITTVVWFTFYLVTINLKSLPTTPTSHSSSPR